MHSTVSADTDTLVNAFGSSFSIWKLNKWATQNSMVYVVVAKWQIVFFFHLRETILKSRKKLNGVAVNVSEKLDRMTLFKALL